MLRLLSTVSLALACCPTCAFSQEGTAAKLARVPFVGCASDGQVGPQAAPTAAEEIQIDASFAPKLAYYKSEEGPGVLAPRGWYCFGTYGSAGSHLFVAPEPIPSKSLFSPDWKGFAGAVIQTDSVSGGTSGRFSVAETIARVFPAYQEFVRQVIAEGILPATDFPVGPYPGDQLTYKSDRVVEFRTPPRTEGLGTHSRLQTNDDWIRGVYILEGPETDLLKLTMRLPANLRSLESPIQGQFEKEWRGRRE